MVSSVFCIPYKPGAFIHIDNSKRMTNISLFLIRRHCLVSPTHEQTFYSTKVSKMSFGNVRKETFVLQRINFIVAMNFRCLSRTFYAFLVVSERILISTTWCASDAVEIYNNLKKIYNGSSIVFLKRVIKETFLRME